MKTKLINFRVDETEFAKIKRVSSAIRLPVTDMIRSGLAMFIRAAAVEEHAGDLLEQAFNELLTSGKVMPLTSKERDLVHSFETRKAGGKLKTISASDVLSDIDAARQGKASRGTRGKKLGKG